MTSTSSTGPASRAAAPNGRDRDAGRARPRASTDGKKVAGSRRRRSHRVVAIRSAVSDRGRVPSG
jgi:hypothetical protein